MTDENRKVDYFCEVESLKEADGIKFDCPKSLLSGQPHKIMIFFEGSDVPPHLGLDSKGKPARWKVKGTNLSNPTLDPSIQEVSGCCGWHGFIKNGEAT